MNQRAFSFVELFVCVVLHCRPSGYWRAEMTERLDTLKRARDRMVEERDAHAKVLAAPFDRDKAERARNKFVEIQTLIDSLERAIGGEQIAG
jgi:hypothetical protein